MRRQFDKELEKLHHDFLEMGELAIRSLAKATAAFVQHDKEGAQQVIDEDFIINQKEVDLEQECATIIALRQPVVSDLRAIVSVMKACSDLERIGDHARSISQTTINVKGNKQIPAVEAQIGNMAKVVLEMAKRVLVAYIDGDVEEAKDIATLDERVDRYFEEIQSYSISEMMADPKVVFNGSGYISTATHLERVADYVTNICERIIYIKTGEMIELN